jgi:NAD(P)H-flavin reductase
MERMPDNNRLVDPMLPRPFVVKRVSRETEDTFTLELTAGDGGELSFGSGQFNMLYVFGAGEVPISISGNPSQPSLLVHTTRSVGTVTAAMASLRRGDAIGVRGPYGSRWPIDEATGSDVLLIAGGIGLAPLRPAVYELLTRREKYGRVVILYGTRTPADILFRKQIEEWRARFDLDVYVTVDRSVGNWRGNVGAVTTLVPRAPFDPLNTIAMVCGPEVMMRFTVAQLEKRGLEHANIYLSVERNMKCAVGFCGHCQFGAAFICKDGPVFRFDQISDAFATREI